jgi:hypothetical protein
MLSFKSLFWCAFDRRSYDLMKFGKPACSNRIIWPVLISGLLTRVSVLGQSRPTVPTPVPGNVRFAALATEMLQRHE